MPSCTCPACFKYPPNKNLGWGLSFKTTQIENEQTLSFTYNNTKQPWRNDSLFTSNKYTAYISTGIPSPKYPSSNDSDSSR